VLKKLKFIAIIITILNLPLIASAESVNVAVNKPSFGSSYHYFSENGAYSPGNGNDGLSTSEWSTDGLSLYSNKQYWFVDLLSEYRIDKITITHRNVSPEHSNYRVIASNSVDFSNAVELIPDVGTVLSLPDDRRVSVTINKTEKFRYIKAEKTVAGQAFGFREFEVYSSDTASTALKPPTLYNAQISNSLLTGDSKAGLSYNFYSQTGTTEGSCIYQWIQTTVIGADPYSTATRWRLINNVYTSNYTVDNSLIGLYIRAIIYPIDSGGTLGKRIMTPLRYVESLANNESRNILSELDEAVVTASSNQPNVINIIDDKNDTVWETSTNDTVKKLVIDLKQPYKINRLEMTPKADCTIADTSNFKVQFANDIDFATAPIEFVQGVTSYNGTDFIGSNQSVFTRDLYYSAGVNGYRYVRMIGDTASTKLSLAELKLFVNQPVNNPPTVIATINGSMVAGQEINCNYSFSDQDGDGEGSHSYKYFISAEKNGEYKLVAETPKYTPRKDSIGSFIKVEMTPRDSKGKKGTPYLSQAYEINNGVKLDDFTLSKNGDLLYTNVVASNLTENPQSFIIIVCLTDKTTNIIQNLKTVSYTLAPSQTQTFRFDSGITHNQIQNKAQAFIWDNPSNMTVLKNTILIN
jgi:hypothetical protein